LGIERLLLLLDAAQTLPAPIAVDVYAVVPSEQSLSQVMVFLDQLRQIGISVQMHAAGVDGRGSMKAQFRKADHSGAKYALIFGEDELQKGQCMVKSLRDAQIPQQPWSLSNLAGLVEFLKA
jgi:histidyl-tRNA synthetase